MPACRPAGPRRSTSSRRAPSSIRPRDSVEAADSQPFLSALESFGTTVRKGDTIFQQGTPQSGHDRCTQPFVQRVPHAPAAVGRRLLSAGAVATSGDSTSNRIALACAPNPSVCGNGVVEVTEQCDDGNTVSCDGCSDHCRREICGNRVVDCGEQCDDGAANGQPGDPCSARCTWNPPAGRIPGGATSRDCVAEWALAAGQLAVARNGLPSNKQTCVDNDPSCDFDPTPGNCRFHLWVCVGGDDPAPRLRGERGGEPRAPAPERLADRSRGRASGLARRLRPPAAADRGSGRGVQRACRSGRARGAQAIGRECRRVHDGRAARPRQHQANLRAGAVERPETLSRVENESEHVASVDRAKVVPRRAKPARQN